MDLQLFDHKMFDAAVPLSGWQLRRSVLFALPAAISKPGKRVECSR